MSYSVAQWAHMGIGTLTLLLYWSALVARKGQRAHRSVGRAFFVAMIVACLTVGPLLFLRPGAFNPAYAVQFGYVSIATITVVMLAWTAIRWKAQPERFRGLHFRILGPTMFVLGAVALGAGLAGGDPLPTFLSWVGLFFGAAMVRFAWMQRPLHPLWWLNWHMTANCLLFTAVHGTFAFVAWRSLVDPDAGRTTAVAFHAGVLLVAVALRLWFGWRRGVPLRFSQPPQAPRVAAAT
jgi:hypothetical protein